jgi:hypothetical protein
MQERDRWNAALAALAATYTGAILVDASSRVGQFRAGGDAGNLWDIKPAYVAADGQGVHFTATGHEQIAMAIHDAIDAATLSDTHVYWWAYTAAPDLVVADNIKTALLDYNGAGKALSAFASHRISVGDPGKTPPLPHIAIIPQAPTLDLETAGGRPFASMSYQILIQVAVVNLEGKSDAWRDCREYLAAIESILWDERRYLYGEAGGAVQPGNLSGPAPTQSELYMVGSITTNHVFHAMWRDDQNPR